MKKNNFEEGLNRLEEIATLLDRGETDLENAVALYEEGTKLSLQLGSLLENAERKLSLAEVDPSAEPNKKAKLKKMSDVGEQESQAATEAADSTAKSSPQKKKKSSAEDMPTLF